ncbi:hypothetical protein DFJ73DRAFT_534514 [Zopfochytrium polystomum]|nr:hypothetical protein DFJ73DRAFT_534514 [Zopfochytrium polystomum]
MTNNTPFFADLWEETQELSPALGYDDLLNFSDSPVVSHAPDHDGDELSKFTGEPDEDVLALFGDSVTSTTLFDSFVPRAESNNADAPLFSPFVEPAPAPKRVKRAPTQSLLPTPPQEPLRNFPLDPKVALTPDVAAQLLAAVERQMHAQVPHLVPAVERLRSQLRGSAAAVTTATATSSSSILSTPLMTPLMAPPTPATRAIRLPSRTVSASPALSALSSFSPALSSRASFSPEAAALLHSFGPGPSNDDGFSALLAEVAGPLTDSTETRADSAEPSTPLIRGPDGELRPKMKVGRKRKDRSDAPAEVQAMLDRKRERNTEAARRSRLRRLAEQEQLQKDAAAATALRDVALAKVKALEEELERAKTMLLVANAQLVTAGIEPMKF